MFFEKLGKVFDMTKLSNRNPCSPIVKPNGLYTLTSYMGNTNLFVSSCFLCTYVPSSLSLSLSLCRSSLRLFPDRPSFLARLTLLPPLLVLPLSFSLDSFVCFPDLLSFLTSLSLDLPLLLVFPYLPFWSFRVSYFAKFLELVLSFGFSQMDSQVRF